MSCPVRQPLPPSLPLQPGRAFPLLLPALLFVLALAAPLAGATYTDGDKVMLTGMVSDKDGQPLAGVRVVFVASRSYWSLRELRRTQDEKETRRVSATTNERGEFSLEWPWDTFFNRFDLQAGIPVRKGRQERFEALATVDVTERVKAGSPVVSALIVQNRGYLDRVRDFVASVKSDDERKTYEEMGNPDQVKRLEAPGSTEVSWWYFESGTMVRFRDGRLEQTVHFDPVKGF